MYNVEEGAGSALSSLSENSISQHSAMEAHSDIGFNLLVLAML